MRALKIASAQIVDDFTIIGPERQLTEPFGFGTGDTVTLTSASRAVDPQRLTDVLLGFGCYKPAIPKIIDCLRASGRYDCTLQTAWFRKQHNALREQLAALGVELMIVNVAEIKGSWHPPMQPQWLR